MVRLQAVEKRLTSEGKLGPVARLHPTKTAATLRKNGKEQFVVEVETLEDAIAAARELAEANPGTGSYEIRPMMIYNPDKRQA
jgi:hypothetical protein